MALSVLSLSISRPSHNSPPSFRTSSNSTSSLILLLRRWNSSLFSTHNLCYASSPVADSWQPIRASSDQRDGASTGVSTPSLLDEELLRRVSSARDADQALDMIAEAHRSVGYGTLEIDDCHSIIAAAFDRANTELALSIFHAMCSGFSQGVSENNSSVKGWTWARPDVRTYALMVRGLAASSRVSDAIRMISYVSRAGVSAGEEVSFGMIVRCPNCMIAIAVAQPQDGVQVASCSKCRYQYELVSGDIVSIDSEEISMDISAWEKALRFLQIMKENIPAALHSIVVRTPSGTARTHKFATKTVELPAQEGERVTISLAAPSNVYREMGPLRLSARSPGFDPEEPICLTNHTSGQVSQLLRAPVKNGGSFFLNPFVLFPTLALLATGDAASVIIDPSLPRLISVAAVASLAVGTTMNHVLLPELRKLPRRTVDVVALKQQLLSQYDLLQTRIKDLRQAAEKEVWMLARMCQLENKIVAVGEPCYRARQGRVKRVRESLENSLLARIELIDSYAKISSMIEIEVEMDSDVLAAEAVSNAESIAEQIQQIMEIENLEERWRLQAEANDEVERLLNSQPASNERV
ncbi:uncharacterized protein LOC103709522 isoform X1 [Phoenix dactylifera]|uniref:Uncharacterized protein LOC103709522 isoform X1 n=2 Tax=Phoenix dactylifera TaxID=42345 RepID=A0A8B7C731_PHODC|nr:uncharacterized protein LOC103709522 isoform X1 [Phoenix dactylifera]